MGPVRPLLGRSKQVTPPCHTHTQQRTLANSWYGTERPLVSHADLSNLKGAVVIIVSMWCATANSQWGKGEGGDRFEFKPFDSLEEKEQHPVKQGGEGTFKFDRLGIKVPGGSTTIIVHTTTGHGTKDASPASAWHSVTAMENTSDRIHRFSLVLVAKNPKNPVVNATTYGTEKK